MGAVWDNTSQDSLTLGPSSDSSTIYLTDDGQYTGQPEIDFTNSEGDLGAIFQDSVGSLYLTAIPASGGGGGLSANLTLSGVPGTGGLTSLQTQGELLLTGNVINLNAFTRVTDGNGNLFLPVARGIAQVTPNTTTGQFTINHGLGVTPGAVTMQLVRGGSAPGTTQPAIIYLLSVDATKITGYIVTLAGALYTGGALTTIHWHADTP